MPNKPDPTILDRIDVRYDVSIVATVDYGHGDHVVHASVLITCGTYDGIADKANIAALVNDRGIQPEDIDRISSIGSWPGAELLAEILNERGVQADDIVEARIAAVTLDEIDIATAEPAQSRAIADAEARGVKRAADIVGKLGNGYAPYQIREKLEEEAGRIVQ